ncbi:MAG: carbonic anhydrase family protein, partial [Gammaproteobacteria bacterium]
MVLPLVAGLPASALAEGGKSHWDYSGKADPSVWSELSPKYAACGGGAEQSPIDIKTAEVVEAKFQPVKVNWQPFTPEVVNNGHTVQTNTNGQGGFAEVAGIRYQLLQFHFHH